MNKINYFIVTIFIVLSLFLIGCDKEVEQFEVTFIDYYGNIIETKTVDSGSSVTPPTTKNIPYHTFDGWDQDLTSVSTHLTVKALYKTYNEEYEMTDANYWLKQLSNKHDIEKVILDENQIKEYNAKITSDYYKTRVVDVLKQERTIKGETVLGLIYRYSNINKYTIYNHETKDKITDSEKAEILTNRNIEALTGDLECQYGIITDFTWMRTYPTNNYAKTYERDYFQETSLNVGEGVIIYHESLDKNWYCVQAANYFGWIEKENVAMCSYEEFSQFKGNDNFLVVLDDFVEILGAHVRMGQTFPLVNQNDFYTILFPTKNENGHLELKEVNLEITDSYHVGYLPYTYENVYKQAFKLLGIDYSWGDKEKDGRDCSSTQNAIYSTFGFNMPRNTSNQNAIPTYGFSLYSVTEQKIRDNYLPGSLIFSDGHVMMYIGEGEDGSSYIFHNTSSGDGKCIIQKLSEYGITRIVGALKLQ